MLFYKTFTRKRGGTDRDVEVIHRTGAVDDVDLRVGQRTANDRGERFVVDHLCVQAGCVAAYCARKLPRFAQCFGQTVGAFRKSARNPAGNHDAAHGNQNGGWSLRLEIRRFNFERLGKARQRLEKSFAHNAILREIVRRRLGFSRREGARRASEPVAEWRGV